MEKNFNPVALELFSAAWCNLDCTYCYIPKHNKFIVEKHKKIIEEVIEVVVIVDRIKKLYGNQLKVVSHWGTEPSLTIQHFGPFTRL